MGFFMSVNKEKQDIIDCPGNVLVTANPGTGKTLLLAYKYLNLLESGVKPEEILCLTFTRKARKEMEDRITKLIAEKELSVDISNIFIHTFHSFALEAIDEENLVSTNLLRYAIFRFLKDHGTLNYGDRYLLDTIVPKMENLIRYLKSFGITFDMINVDEAKKFLSDFKNYTREDLERFLIIFVDIFRFYEEMKGEEGLDYTDMLIDFLKQKNIPHFRYVLVDELQDVNTMEADIALRSADVFIAVGDQKQAIFGFQGGSILNFEKFKDSTSFVLSENFRSTNAILDYARKYFSSKTQEKHHIKELEHLENKTKGFGEKPVIFDVAKDQVYTSVCTLARSLSNTGSSVAVIARTNTQIMKISKEMKKYGIDHSSTFFSASSEAQASIISFLKGMLSDDIHCIKDAMFTPFFPISLQDAFYLSEKKGLTLWEVYDKSPSFRYLKKRLGNIEDVNSLFHQCIIPISVSYGEEYLLASLAMKDAFFEAMKVVEDKNVENICAFLESTDLLSSESHTEKDIMLTTVHKAKGKQFDSVIYVPTKTQNRANFQDAVVKAILTSHGINAEEELEEETLRVNFVAFTRAKNNLYIVTDKPKEYVNDAAVLQEITGEQFEGVINSEYQKRAFILFVNKQYDTAKKLLEEKKVWLQDFVLNHFENLESLSFSSITTDPYEYFKRNILKLGMSSDALRIGSEVHVIAENMIEGEEYGVNEELQPYETNIKKLINEIHQEYPSDVLVEENIMVPLSNLIETDENILFRGKIDAVFKNDNEEYLIVDWKTSKNTNYGGDHRQQLSAYKKAFSIKNNIPLEHIKVAIGYVGLKKTIDDGIMRTELDKRQPSSSAFNTFSKHVETVLSWKKDINLFFEELKQVKNDDALLRSILEQYESETT